MSAQQGAQPTAGKWEAYITTVGVVGAPSFKLVAQCASEADALLIAAAPALLNALQEFMATDQSFSTASDKTLAALVVQGNALAPIVMKARAAIAAATGEQA